ncbi:JmjC domain-containing protein [Pseudomonas sp. S3_G06]
MRQDTDVRILSDLLDADVPIDFFQHYYGARPCLLRGRHNRPPPFGWNDLNLVLQSHRLHPPRLRIEHSDFGAIATSRLHNWVPTHTVASAPVLRRKALYTALENGGTLILDCVDEVSNELRTLSIGLTSILEENIGMNCYVSFGNDDSFGRHWDEHDVFALQVAGEKHWTLFDDSDVASKSGFRTSTRDCPGEAITEIDLCEGDVLYIPRGYWHEVKGVDRPSLHISVGVARVRAIDLLRSLLDDLEEHEIWGASLPRHASSERIQAFEMLLTKAFDELVQRPIAVDAFFRRSEKALRPPVVVNLPWAVESGTPIRGDTLVTWLAPVGHTGEPLGLGTSYDGLTRILCKGSRTIAELMLLAPTVNVEEIVRSLAKDGLVGLTHNKSLWDHRSK